MSAFAHPQTIPLSSATSMQSAYLVKFPEAVWRQILDNVHRDIAIEMSGGAIALSIAGSSVPLDAHVTSAQTDILQAAQACFTKLGQAAVRLSVPFEPTTTPLSAVKAAAVPLERSHSSPVTQNRSITASVPLKTRVLQALALGYLTPGEIAERVKAPEADVMRVVKVVGRQANSEPLRYSLLPTQYAKVKIGEWGYTDEERERVVSLSRTAFEELGLGSDSAEWKDLEKRTAAPPGSAAPGGITNRSPPASPVARPPKSPLRSEVAKIRSDRGRATSAPIRAKSAVGSPDVQPTPKPKQHKRRRRSQTPHFTSSEEESPSGSSNDSREKRSRLAPKVQPEPDPEKLRDRYDELYPAYQKLTLELAAIHQAAEQDQLHTALSETQRMVLKWERWHAELSRIRLCFGEV